MEKNSRVEVDKTPSMVSGEKASKITRGEPLAGKEKCPVTEADISKVANARAFGQD